MNTLHSHRIDEILGRSSSASDFQSTLQLFQQNIHEFHKQSGIYVYGETGVGKTQFVKHLLTELGYNVVLYDASHIRNTSFIENLNETKLSNNNVFQLFHRRSVKNAIVMDEVDGMNNGDKGGINALIQAVRPKKTKRQKLESSVNSPVICIGNMQMDKKIQELMKVCFKIKLNTPTNQQIHDIIREINPTMNAEHAEHMVMYTNGNLHKLNTILNLYNTNIESFLEIISLNTLQWSFFNDEAKTTIKKLVDRPFTMECHEKIINDADRTSVGLLWHENIIDLLPDKEPFKCIQEYRIQLDNICFADYIDRITFQKQIWELGELSSLIKVFYNHFLFHNKEKRGKSKSLKEVRFTKILTKYSTEFGNVSFINRMGQKMLLDKTDLFSFFNAMSLRSDEEIKQMLIVCDIPKLDYDRMLRFINALHEVG